MTEYKSRRILFTGAAGGIGTMIRPLLAPLYPGLVLSDKVKPANLLPSETFVAADLSRLDEVVAAVKGAHSVIHLGGFSVEGPWDTILQANIVGCYNMFEAARQAGLKLCLLITSNDNVRALAFYQKRGWRLTAGCLFPRDGRGYQPQGFPPSPAWITPTWPPR